MAIREEDKEIWHGLRYADVASIPARVRAGVQDLEAAYLAGRLPDELAGKDYAALLGPVFVTNYERLADSPVGPLHHLRVDAVDALLVQMEYDLAPLQVMEMEAMHADRRHDPVTGEANAFESLGDFRLAGDSASPAVRPDQLLDACFWRVGFRFRDEALDDAYAQALVRRSVSRLGGSISGIRKILDKFRPAALNRKLQLVSYPESCGFEHLVLDILNEDSPVARQASLIEDFMEKTDIRVKYDWLDRRRGARVQVTAITSPEVHKAKLDAISLAQEYVFLSPRTLAEFAIDIMAGEVDSPGIAEGFPVKELAGAIGTPDQDVDAVALGIKGKLFSAIHSRIRHPVGPSMSVAPVLRRLVRAFVEKNAVQSTSALRQRRADMGDAPSVDPEVAFMLQDQRVRAFSPGDKVRGIVEKIVDYGAFVQTGDITGLLHVSRIPDGKAGSLHLMFSVGDEIEVEVVEVDLVRRRIGLGLVPREGRLPGDLADLDAGDPA